MNTAQPYTDALERALGVIIARAREHLSLIEQRGEALLATFAARVAEAEAKLASVEARIVERLASVKDGADGASVTLADVAPMIADAVERAVAVRPTMPTAEDLAPAIADAVAGAVAVLPPPEPAVVDMTPIIRSEVEAVLATWERPKDGRDADPDAMRSMIAASVAEAVAALPPPEPGRDGESIKGDPGQDGASVTIDDVRPIIMQEIERQLAGWERPKDGADADPDVIRGMVAEAVAALPPPEPGPPGPPGMLPLVRAWEDRVYREGEAVSFEGGTYQATRLTGKPPSHADWQCIAARGEPGERGQDGRSFTHRGTYDPTAEYRELDIVALNGSSFSALRDGPGPCPGDGWQLIASAGGRGKAGEPGKRGDPGPAVRGISIDGNGIVTLQNADGTVVASDWYPVLASLER